MIQYKKIINILLIQFLFAFSMTGSAQILNIDEYSEVYSLGTLSFVLIDTSGTLTFEEVRTEEYQSQFKASTSETLNYGVTPHVIWLKVSIRNQAADPSAEWLLALDYALFDYLSFFQKNPADEWVDQNTGDQTLFRERPIPNRNFVFSTYLPTNETKDLYLRFQTSGSMQINPKLYRERQFLRKSTRSEILYGLFYGGVLIIILYNLFLFFSLKDWSYLSYCLFIFVTTFLQATYSGHVNEYFLGNNLYWANQIIPITMVLVPVFIALFAILFLKTKVFTPLWHKVLIGVILVSVIHLILCFFLPTSKAISIAGLINTLSQFIVITVGIISYRKGNKAARFYIIAWSILILTGLMSAFRLFGIIPNNFFTVHGVRFGIWLEAILLSLALADKYNLFRKEKELAQERLLKMQEGTNRMLEEKVRNRTAELAQTNEKLSETLQKVDEERQKSDELLLNILPAETAAELKEKGHSSPKQYHLATVLFTDFKNFTRLAEVLPPEKIIEVLDICFLAFDEICERNNIEKIKTIGDSYMAAGGVPVANVTNPIDAVKAALEIQEWMAEWDQEKYTIPGQKWEVRIGVHSGPVMAGVVGKNKFAYDIWGKTVNVASRMESSGVVNHVTISKETYERVNAHFDCEYKGKVRAKNLGETEVYWVNGYK